MIGLPSVIIFAPLKTYYPAFDARKKAVTARLRLIAEDFPVRHATVEVNGKTVTLAYGPVEPGGEDVPLWESDAPPAEDQPKNHPESQSG